MTIQGKDPLVASSQEWAGDYPGVVEHERSSRRRRRRHHHHRRSWHARREHRRLLRTAVLCSVVLLGMVLGLYAFLSHNDHAEGSRLATPATGRALA
jgi:hypothetical protein